jgi:UDPglucose 6-dehydrogenase
MAREAGFHAELAEAVDAVNQRQKQRLYEKIATHFAADGLRGRTFAVWGLAFKPNTDDMRDAPSIDLIEALLAAGATVQAFDPVAMDSARKIMGERAGLQLCKDAKAALQGADALAVVTEWHAFRSPDFNHLAAQLRARVVFDGRNLWEPLSVRAAGLTYYGIGRG